MDGITSIKISTQTPKKFNNECIDIFNNVTKIIFENISSKKNSRFYGYNLQQWNAIQIKTLVTKIWK